MSAALDFLPSMLVHLLWDRHAVAPLCEDGTGRASNHPVTIYPAHATCPDCLRLYEERAARTLEHPVVIEYAARHAYKECTRLRRMVDAAKELAVATADLVRTDGLLSDEDIERLRQHSPAVANLQKMSNAKTRTAMAAHNAFVRALQDDPRPRRVLYIAHPLTGSGCKVAGWANMDRNIERYLRFVAWANLHGYTVVSWIHHSLTHARALTKGDPDFYLDDDKVLISLCNVFWQAGPLEASHGMQVEVAKAVACGIPIVHEDQWDDPNWWLDLATSPPEAP